MTHIQSTSDLKEYYGAANTGAGFYSLFNNIFSPEKIEKIYILKGGPGCGKSTALKKIAEYALNKGLDIEKYYCSSSPSSLDGVIIPKISTAVLDGTAPHTVDPKYPAVCENIINLGESWDLNKATDINVKIRELVKKKAEAYQRAYAYLSSCISAEEVIDNCLKGYLLEDKLFSAVERICSKIKLKKSDGKTSKVFTDCICGNGNVHLNTFEKLSSTRYFIKDYADISGVFYGMLANELTSRGANITVALNPLSPDKYKGIYIDDSDISFTEYDDEFCLSLDRKQLPYKIINTARFCNGAKFKKNKVFYKYADKSRKILMNGAIKQLSIAANAHDETEKLYYNITDFSKVQQLTENLIVKIFE
ncbi:MAG: hypothetical protein IKI97_14760 [Clostridia bacterium]|nr:hypothetical protein [Clostridia bacterium]